MVGATRTMSQTWSGIRAHGAEEVKVCTGKGDFISEWWARGR